MPLDEVSKETKLSFDSCKTDLKNEIVEDLDKDGVIALIAASLTWTTTKHYQALTENLAAAAQRTLENTCRNDKIMEKQKFTVLNGGDTNPRLE